MTRAEYISSVLRKLGVGDLYVGHRLTVEATLQVLADPDKIFYVTKDLYPSVAKKFDASVYCVERNIRTVTHVAYKSNRKLLTKIMCCELSCAPTATKFVDALAHYVKRNYGKRKTAPYSGTDQSSL